MENDRVIEPWMYRSSNENIVLLITLIVLGVVGWLFFNLNLYIFVGGVIFAIVAIHIQQVQYLGSAVRVYSKQFPEIYELFKAHATKLGIEKASLYIRQDPTMNAGTTGITRCTVILNSALVEQLSLKELSFVLGHELGHFQAGHTKLSSIFSPLGNIGNNFIGIISNIIFGYWQRLTEYSCDNCGLVVTKDVDSAVTAIIKLAIGKALFDKLDMDAYIKQIKKSQTNSVKLSEALALSSHPLTANRVANLVSFWRENFQRRAEGVS
jgi:Zn-dependent protease with chaperone function